MRLRSALTSVFATLFATAATTPVARLATHAMPRFRRAPRMRFVSTPKCDNCGTVLPEFRCGGFCLPCRDEANQAEGRKFKRR